MTLANRKRLYAHYKEVGYTKALKDLVERYPELEAKPEVKKIGKKPEG